MDLCFWRGLRRGAAHKTRGLFVTAILDRPMGAQLGGYVKSFEQNVSFVTIHGAGHMVPEFKPVAGLQLFKRVLFNLPLRYVRLQSI